MKALRSNVERCGPWTGLGLAIVGTRIGNEFPFFKILLCFANSNSGSVESRPLSL